MNYRKGWVCCTSSKNKLKRSLKMYTRCPFPLTPTKKVCICFTHSIPRPKIPNIKRHILLWKLQLQPIIFVLITKFNFVLMQKNICVWSRRKCKLQRTWIRSTFSKMSLKHKINGCTNLLNCPLHFYTDPIIRRNFFGTFQFLLELTQPLLSTKLGFPAVG